LRFMARCAYHVSSLHSEAVVTAIAPEQPQGEPPSARLGDWLGLHDLRTVGDVLRAVEDGLSIRAVDALTGHGLSDQEVYRLIIPRRTLSHRRARRSALSREESDRAVRVARITALAEEVFGDRERALRWLRKPKQRFELRTPIDLLATEVGARLVEEMLLQVDHGVFA
jgi:putative toxin-antitoxin system antitoxin component (TIGR02293 family)